MSTNTPHRHTNTETIRKTEIIRGRPVKAELSVDRLALMHLSMIGSRDVVHGWSATKRKGTPIKVGVCSTRAHTKHLELFKLFYKVI